MTDVKPRVSRQARTPVQSQGPATDRNNSPVVDPTENVLSLVSAAMTRQDDLRNASVAYLREITAIHVSNLEKMAELRTQHSHELRQAESERINAIRAVDVGAVNRAAEVAATVAATLASQVSTVAETLRTQVAAAATAQTQALSAALEPIQLAVAELRRLQYEQQGEKGARGDVRTEGRDRRDAVADWRGWAFGLISLAFALYELTRTHA